MSIFGEKARGTDGRHYDSIQESEVASSLADLKAEKIVGGYLAHVKICGFNADFVVSLGSESGSEGQMVAVEYDGLGLARERDLGKKVLRYKEAARIGLEVRWLIGTSIEEVREVLLDYSEPPFVDKRILCPVCGRSDLIRVIDRDGKVEGTHQVEKPCSKACRRAADYAPGSFSSQPG